MPREARRLVDVVCAEHVTGVLALPVLAFEVGRQMHHDVLPFECGLYGFQVGDVRLKVSHPFDVPSVEGR